MTSTTKTQPVRRFAAVLLAATMLGCRGAGHGATTTTTGPVSVGDCVTASAPYAEPAVAPCATALRERHAEIVARWASFTPYERFFLRRALAPAALPAGPDALAVEACAAIASAPVHWLGAPVVAPTPLATELLATPDLETCLPPIVAYESRVSFLDDGEGNTLAQASELTRGDVAGWFVTQLHPPGAVTESAVAPDHDGPTAAETAELEMRGNLRAAGSERDVRRHLRALRAAAPSELDESCASERWESFGDRLDAFDGPTVSRSGACIDDHCHLRLESEGERSITALDVYYTRGEGGVAQAIECEVLHGC